MSHPINFCETRFHYLSPFSAHEVLLEGVRYKTAEHAYQALRVIENAREPVINAASPHAAWREGQKCKERGLIVSDYDKDELMEKIFRAKLEQHDDIKEILLESGVRELKKVISSDSYWGTGADGAGQNQMGKIWMKLRAALNQSNS